MSIDVIDHGLGIPGPEQERIFEKFYRLDPNLTRGVGGTGLGLYICRELVKRMDGRIWVASKQGQGSTFFFELPAVTYLGFWALSQVFAGTLSLATPNQVGGVAWWAHVGGFIAGIVLQFAGCALLLAGWHADVGVILLIIFTVLATGIFHRFWQRQDPVQRNASRIALLSNVAIVGGLLLLLENVRS